MLTRLKVTGFKNLIDLDVRFGPFTCIAGVNGVGKSNVFDAILFLSVLADSTLLEAAASVRGESRGADALRVLSRGPSGRAESMRLEAEMIVPKKAEDDLGQVAQASTTALRYSVSVRAREDQNTPIPQLEIEHESLVYFRKGDLSDMLPFARGKRYAAWRESVFEGRRTSPFISTLDNEGEPVIKVHEDSGHQGRSRKVRAAGLGRTILSTLNTSETPTALIARREMQSWRLLQLEPTRLRTPDDMKASARLEPDGSGLAATLHRLLSGHNGDAEAVRARIGGRLHELVRDIREVWVDSDVKRELLTVMARSREGTEFRARDLSDGTLRFLALSVLEQDPTWNGLLCLEEPENGIHPTRIPSMLEVLQSLAVDLEAPVADDNPLRQIIINTHSPQVVGLVPEDSILFAGSERSNVNGCNKVSLQPLDGTWRTRDNGSSSVVPKGAVLEMLNALPLALRVAEEQDEHTLDKRRVPSVARRNDFSQMILPGVIEEEG